MGMLDDPEMLDDIRVLTEREIGMLKLMAVSNRCSFKDVYDLHYLTENIALPDLLLNLKEKDDKDFKHENSTSLTSSCDELMFISERKICFLYCR